MAGGGFMNWKIGVHWNRKGEQTIEMVGPILYNARVHYGISLWIITVGWWRDAKNIDYKEFMTH